MTFKELNLVDPILKALEKTGYKNPTPIQEQSIPILLRGKDLLGCAQTGTGKTAAFAIPILQNVFLSKEREDKGRRPNDNRKIRALIVTPTRELAIQIADNFTTYSNFIDVRNTVIFGGVKQSAQVNALRRGVDVLVATPGRLLDLIDQRIISLRDIEYFVLDEADHMLDMGFINPIKKIISMLPRQRQSLFFSATMPPKIMELATSILAGDYQEVTIDPEQATAERVDQGVYFVSKSDKTKLLVHLIEKERPTTTLVFSRTKHGANKIVKSLDNYGIVAEAIHGNKSQVQRQRALDNFKEGKTAVLIATDIAARGIDVSGLAMVVNYDLPNVAETYVHRIGRTGRAKMSGVAFSFCNSEERPYLRDIQKLIDQQIPVMKDNPYEDDGTEVAAPKVVQQGRQSGGRGQRPGSNSNRRTPVARGSGDGGGRKWGRR